MKHNYAAAHSLADPDKLAAVLTEAYPLPEATNCMLVSPGVNDTYRVAAGAETYYCRVYRAGLRSGTDIDFELALLGHLQQQGVAVSVPVPRKDGSLITHLAAPEGSRPAVLFTRAPGRVLEYTAEEAREYGSLIARLHTAMDSFRSDQHRCRLDLAYLLERPLRLIQPYAAEAGLWDFYSTLADRLRSRVEAAAPMLERGICHGDLHGHNVHKAEDGQLTLFDFDCGGPGWRAYDLACYRWAVVRHAKDLQPWEAFVSGYRTLRPVGQADLDITPTFVAIRTLWLIGLQIEQVNQRGTSWVQMWVDGAAQFLRRYADAEAI